MYVPTFPEVLRSISFAQSTSGCSIAEKELMREVCLWSYYLALGSLSLNFEDNTLEQEV